MPKVYSVKVDDATAHHFDNALRVLGTTANAKLNELISEYMLGKPEVNPPPVPVGLPPPLPAAVLPLAVVMRRLLNLAAVQPYALTPADATELWSALTPLERHFQYTAQDQLVADTSETALYNLVQQARRIKDNLVVPRLVQGDRACLYAVEDDTAGLE